MICLMAMTTMFLAAGGNVAYSADDIQITSLQVQEDNLTIHIHYRISGDILGHIESITIEFFENLPGIDGSDERFNFETENYFEWSLGTPLTQPVSFRLVANLDPSGVKTTSIHSIIFFDTIASVAEECEIAVDLSWINYTIYHSTESPPSPLPFGSVEVYAYPTVHGTCDLTNEILVASMPQPLWDSNETFVIPGEMEPGDTYCFQIHSVGDDQPATSNIKVLELDVIVPTPDKPSIGFVDVVDNDYMRIMVDLDDSHEYKHVLYRSDTDQTSREDYDLIEEVVQQESSLVFYDHDVPAFDGGPWYYYVESSVTDCPGSYNISWAVSSIYLKEVDFDPDSDEELSIELNWLHHTYGSHIYSLKRQVGEEEPEPLYNFDFDNDSYTDIIDADRAGGSFTYWIEAEWSNYPVEIFHSNRITVTVDILDKAHIPRAFRPGSEIEKNSYFRLPFTIPPEEDSYSMKIFDRNGLLVYFEDDWDADECNNNHSSAADCGWDGTFPSGDKAPAGTYVYEARFRSPGSNESESIQGTISLVR